MGCGHSPALAAPPVPGLFLSPCAVLAHLYCPGSPCTQPSLPAFFSALKTCTCLPLPCSGQAQGSLPVGGLREKAHGKQARGLSASARLCPSRWLGSALVRLLRTGVCVCWEGKGGRPPWVRKAAAHVRGLRPLGPAGQRPGGTGALCFSAALTSLCGSITQANSCHYFPAQCAWQLARGPWATPPTSSPFSQCPAHSQQQCNREPQQETVGLLWGWSPVDPQEQSSSKGTGLFGRLRPAVMAGRILGGSSPGPVPAQGEGQAQAPLRIGGGWG